MCAPASSGGGVPHNLSRAVTQALPSAALCVCIVAQRDVRWIALLGFHCYQRYSYVVTSMGSWVVELSPIPLGSQLPRGGRVSPAHSRLGGNRAATGVHEPAFHVLDHRSWTTQQRLRTAIVTWIERTSHCRRQRSLARLNPIENTTSSPRRPVKPRDSFCHLSVQQT